MPLNFLKLIKKDKPGKIKLRSKSSADIYQQNLSRRCTEIFDGNFQAETVPDVVPTFDKSLKVKSKSRLSIFSLGKSDLEESFKNDKKSKRNSIALVSAKSEAVLGNAANRKQSTVSNKSDPNLLKVPNENNNTEGKLRPNRSASCVSFRDLSNRERRISDIAQLDNYIEYYQRRGTEDGINTKRVCCAQMLLTGLLRAEQMSQSGMLRSQDNLDSDNNMNTSPTGGHLYHKNKLSPKYRSTQWNFPTNNGYRHSISDEGSRRSSCIFSDDSENKDEDGPIQFTCRSVPDNDSGVNVRGSVDGGVNERNSRRVSDSSDSFVNRDFIKKPKFMSKRKSVPVLTSEIEIF